MAVEESSPGHDTSEAEAVTIACIDTCHRALVGTLPLAPVGGALLMVVMRGSASQTMQLVWLGALVLGALAGVVTARRWIADNRRGEAAPRFRAGPLTEGFLGTVWGLAAILPGASASGELRALVAVFLIGVSAIQLVGVSARHEEFFAFQVPLLLISAIRYGTLYGTPVRVLGIAMPLFLVAAVFIHRQLHEVGVNQIELRIRNGQLVDELVAANESLSALAWNDGMTGLANRAAFIERLDRELDRARVDGSPLAVLYFDVDGLKPVNDTLGHAAGDELLRVAAERLRGVVRDADLAARFGGDEFVLLLSGIENADAAIAIAERLRESLAKPFRISGRMIQASASLGVATNDDPRDRAADLLRHADVAQYRAKEAGRNRVVFFDATMRAGLAQRVTDEADLRRALDAGEIEPWYQPQIEMATGRVSAAEALLRWRHPVRGVLPAAMFLPLARSCGLLHDVEHMAVVRAIEARCAMADAGVDDSFRVWINVSPLQLQQAEALATFRGWIERSGARGSWLGIEITEQAVLTDTDTAVAHLGHARDMGLRVALDDFGTGYSSLALIQHLPLDVLKIDRSFVAEVASDPRDAAIVRSVIGLADDVGLSVVAEGVETVEQAEHLMRMGCTTAQGYLYSQAVPQATLLSMLNGEFSLPYPKELNLAA